MITTAQRLLIRSALLIMPFGLAFGASVCVAQQLDLDDLPSHRKTPTPLYKLQDTPRSVDTPADASPDAPMSSKTKPIAITISKTLYLPPAMYGQWNVIATLIESNYESQHTVDDIWVLERTGDEVVITNPANGASAAISVDEVIGNRATFHRMLVTQKNRFLGDRYLNETHTITVNGDRLSGRSLRKVQIVKNGQVAKEYFSVFNIEAQRLSGGRVQFRPEVTEEGPDLEIAPIQTLPKR